MDTSDPDFAAFAEIMDKFKVVESENPTIVAENPEEEKAAPMVSA